MHPVLGGDARLHAFVDPLVFRAPVNVALGLEHVGAAAAEAQHRPAHVLDRHIAGEDQQVGPGQVLPVFLLDRPKEPAGLVEVAIVGPGIEGSEALLPAIGAAAPVGRAIGARRVPRHADEERAVMAVIRRPPWLAVGHQGLEVFLNRPVIERIECLGIVEIFAVRVGRTVGSEDLGCQHLRPPVLVGTAEQCTSFAVGHRAAAHPIIASLHVHNVSPLAKADSAPDSRSKAMLASVSAKAIKLRQRDRQKRSMERRGHSWDSFGKTPRAVSPALAAPRSSA